MTKTIIPTMASLRERVGQQIYTSPWVELAQPQVNAFADATGARQWIHLDAERAKKESPFGGPVAHGYLVLSLVPQLANAGMSISDKRVGVTYGLERVRFVSPVVVPAFVRGIGKLLAYEDIDGGAQLNWEVTIEVQGRQKPACVAQTVTRAYR